MYHKHLREDQWERISGAFPGEEGCVGRPVPDNRKFVEAVIWIGKNGGKWRCLPEEYGKWGSVHKRFKRWSDKGIWQMIFNTLVEDVEMEWVMIDATIIRAHQYSFGAKGGGNKT